MIYQLIKPDPILSPYIKGYWAFEINLDNHYLIPLIPHALIELTFQYGDLIKNNSHETLPRTYISGQRSYPTNIRNNGKTKLILVLFYPFGASLFFKEPMINLENKNIDLSNLDRIKIKEIEEKLLEKETLIERIKLIESFLITHLKESSIHNFIRIQRSLSLIHRSKGKIKVSQIAKKVFVSTKQLTRDFKKYIGLNPKDFIQIIRFQYIIYQKQIKKNISLSDLAYQSGFFDQAHFINNFKQFAGLTPSSFFNSNGYISDYFTPF